MESAKDYDRAGAYPLTPVREYTGDRHAAPPADLAADRQLYSNRFDGGSAMNLPRTCLALMTVVCIALQSCGAERTAPPAIEGLPQRFVNSQGQRYLLVPGGTFEMGPLKPREPDQAPRHTVTLSPFYCAAFEVTKAQFRVFAHERGIEEKFPELDPSAIGADKNWAYHRAPGDDFPMYYIDWNTASEYARWLSKQEGRVYRLPTEAEWEYVCRAGTETWYWWGDAWKWRMAYARDDDYRRAPNHGFLMPGTNPCNPWGFYEILGNVAEWTQDWHRDTTRL